MNQIPFPVHTLPGPAQALVVQGAAAIGCDPGMLGPLVLVMMAAGIGNARTVELQPGWREPSVLWVAVVAPSGSAKSPALDLAVRPLEDQDGNLFRAYAESVKAYEELVGKERIDFDRPDFPPTEPPDEPCCERLVTSDATFEAVVHMLQCSPRGMIYSADELMAFFGGFTRYSKGGRQASEEARWLPFQRAGTIKLDRKTTEPVRVERAALSIAGMIQPGILSQALKTTDFDSGLVARFFLSMPPIPVKVWRKGGGLSQSVQDKYADLISELLVLPINPDGEPPASTLTSEAELVWAEYHDALNARVAISDERERAMLSKLEGGAARLALVVHLGRWASGEPVDLTRIDGESMTRGVKLARWFTEEALRVYAMMEQSEDDRQAQKLADFIRRRGGSINKRQLMKSAPKQFPTATAAQKALEDLEKRGLGKIVYPPPGPEGGRPEIWFELSPDDGQNPA